MTNMTASQPDPWVSEGQRLAPLLDQLCAVVIAGTDAAAAAAFAIGVARAQGAKRRVAIADLIGESPALEALNSSDDPHGIADSFLYGVSLNRIARQVNEAGTVFLMPSGTEPVAHEAVYANDRWRRLAAGFHQVGALLLVVAVPGTPGFAELAGFVGAVMPVGDTRFPMPAGIPIVAAPPVVQPQTPTPPKSAEKVARAREAAVDTNDNRRMRLIAVVVALGAVAVAIGAMWPQIVTRLPAPIAEMFTKTAPDTTSMLVKPTPMDTTQPVDTSIKTDSAALLGGPPMAAIDSTPLPIANPADSVSPAQYAIFYTSANSRAQAIADERLKAQPALAVAPVILDGAEWFQVYIGASADKAGAEMLLSKLRAAQLISGGNISSVPFAFRLEGGVAAANVANRITSYDTKGVLAYAMMQTNGTATLYTGAYQAPFQAKRLADSLRALGITPVLAYRTGRAF